MASTCTFSAISYRPTYTNICTWKEHWISLSEKKGDFTNSYGFPKKKNWFHKPKVTELAESFISIIQPRWCLYNTKTITHYFHKCAYYHNIFKRSFLHKEDIHSCYSCAIQLSHNGNNVLYNLVHELKNHCFYMPSFIKCWWGKIHLLLSNTVLHFIQTKDF